MRLKTIVLLLAFTLPVCSFAGEPEDVHATFDGYKSAVLSQKGEAAVGFVTKGTVEEFQNYVNWALDADRKTLESLSLANRLQVVLIRHRVPAAELTKMDGKSCFVYAVDRDWIGKNGVIHLGLGKVDISNERATAEATVGGEKTPLRMQFRKEGGQWRLDLKQLMQVANAGLVAMAKKEGITENELILVMAESVSGRKVPETIWDPVRAEASHH